MTTLSLSRPQFDTVRATFLDGLFSAFNRAAARREAYLETKRELSWLSDRELADVGIVRDNIDVVARHAADAL